MNSRNLPVPIDDFPIEALPEPIPDGSPPARPVCFWVTIGPRYQSPAQIRPVLSDRVRAARISTSKFAVDCSALDMIGLIREAAPTLPICLDLSGPKLRISGLHRYHGEGIVQLTRGQRVWIGNSEALPAPGEAPAGVTVLPVSAALPDAAPGMVVFLSDGWLQLEVERIVANRVLECRVLNDSPIHEARGIDFQGLYDHLDPVTKSDLDLIRRVGPQLKERDWIALSFTRCASDVARLRAMLATTGVVAKVVAKIETPSGVANAPAIAEASDALMIGRGDLAVQIAGTDRTILEVEDELREICRVADRPCIIGTRVADSLADGKDRLNDHERFRLFHELRFPEPLCLMLSEETADPAQAPTIIRQIEAEIAGLAARVAGA